MLTCSFPLSTCHHFNILIVLTSDHVNINSNTMLLPISPFGINKLLFLFTRFPFHWVLPCQRFWNWIFLNVMLPIWHQWKRLKGSPYQCVSSFLVWSSPLELMLSHLFIPWNSYYDSSPCHHPSSSLVIAPLTLLSLFCCFLCPIPTLSFVTTPSVNNSPPLIAFSLLHSSLYILFEFYRIFFQ